MALNHNRLRGALTLAGIAALATLAACGEDSVDITNPPNLENDMFRTYVAIGNSITAGFQSGGINDSTQHESYAFYLADSILRTTYVLQRLRMPGCTPPQATFNGPLVGGVVSTPTAPFCAGLLPQVITTVNNVGVPGATIADATSNATPASNVLTLLLSGGKSQVTRALEANPTFLTVWLGNNDVLDAASKGLLNTTAVGGVQSRGLTPVSQFTPLYQRMVDSLKLAPRLQGGALVGVVDVTNIPLLFAGALLNNPQVKGAIDQAAGRVVTVINCPPTTQALISFPIVQALRANAALPISCTPIPGSPAGNLFVIDETERTTLTETVAAYNAFIQAKATELDFAFVDPNPILASLRASGGVPIFPNLLSATEPFGEYFSLDGAHPRRKAHKLVANAIAKAVSAKYSIPLDTLAVQ